LGGEVREYMRIAGDFSMGRTKESGRVVREGAHLMITSPAGSTVYFDKIGQSYLSMVLASGNRLKLNRDKVLVTSPAESTIYADYPYSTVIREVERKTEELFRDVRALELPLALKFDRTRGVSIGVGMDQSIRERLVWDLMGGELKVNYLQLLRADIDQQVQHLSFVENAGYPLIVPDDYARYLVK
jgi:hypothetical protein